MARKINLNKVKLTGLTTVGDIHYDSTSVLMNFEGTNGQTAHYDQSKYNHTLTNTGAVALSSSQKPFGATSASFNGSTKYLRIAHNASAFDFSGDFTIEVSFRTATTSGFTTILDKANYDGPGSGPFCIAVYNGYLYLAIASGGSFSSWNVMDYFGTYGIAVNTWYHLAVSRSGSSLKAFVNGVLIASATSSAALVPSSQTLSIGRRQQGASGGSYFNGFIKNLRITIGVGRYESNYSSPTTIFKTNSGDVGKNLIVASDITSLEFGTSGANKNKLVSAWANFNSVTGTITNSSNISSITDGGNGIYTVNFVAPFLNANYIFCTAPTVSSTLLVNAPYYYAGYHTKTTTAFSFSLYDLLAGTASTNPDVYIAFFG